MTKKITIPSIDIYTYEKQALDMLDQYHPHYEEVRLHLLEQIKDDLNDTYHSETDRQADTTGENSDFYGFEAFERSDT